jgi:hypothetical protein
MNAPKMTTVTSPDKDFKRFDHEPLEKQWIGSMALLGGFSLKRGFSMKYHISAVFLSGLLISQPIFAQEFQITEIHTSNSLGGDFDMLILGAGIGRIGPVANGDAEKSNLHIKLAISKSKYGSNYDSVPGQGTNNGKKFLLAYGIQMSESTNVTLTGGLSNRRINVRPVTASSPSDTKEWGPFVSADIYTYFGDKGSVYALADYDRTGSVYTMATYVKPFWGFNIGPSIKYLSDKDYESSSLGITASYKLNKNLEVTLSAGRIKARVVKFPTEYGNYLDFIFKISF